jgi:hypothetical protein
VYDNTLPFQPGQRVWHIGQKPASGRRSRFFPEDVDVRGSATVLEVRRGKVGYLVRVKPDWDRHPVVWFSANTRRCVIREVSR